MKWRFYTTILFFTIYQICCQRAFTQEISQDLQDLSLTKSTIPVVPGSKGDVDGNGAIEIFDLLRARDISLGRLLSTDDSQIFAGDINSDSFVRKDDVEKIRDILLLRSVPPPTIFSINPESGQVGNPIAIDGAGFDPIPSNNLVTFGGVEATVNSATKIKLTVTVPVGAASGNVIVTTGGQSSNRVSFQVTVSENAPFISRITPESPLRRQEVIIDGERFSAVQGNSEVRFGDAKAESDDIISWSDTKIITRVPTSAFPGIVTVFVDTKVSNGFAFNVVVVEATAPDSSDIIENADGIRHIRNVIILDFHNNTTLDQISDFLSQHDLTQIGMIFRPRMIQARIDDGRDPFELAESLMPDDILQGAFPSLLSHSTAVVSESYPDRILQSYNPSKGTFSTPRTKAWYHHFAMQTYAGHRLAEFILSKLPYSRPTDVAVAVIDAGLGDGSTNYPDEFASRIRMPTSVSVRGDLFYWTGVVELKDIPDNKYSHGSTVAGLAAGSGVVSLGTGKHVYLRPLKQVWTTAYVLDCALEIAMHDQEVKVINISAGSYITWLPEFINKKIRDIQLSVYTEQIDAALDKGKIIVTAAGNENVDTGLSAPSALAPEYQRKSGDRNILNVAATISTFTYEEERWGMSNFGEKVSVSAPGDFTGPFIGGLLSRNYGPTGGSGGTSFSAPLVAGLAAEMILIDKALVRLGLGTHEMSPETIIQIIEATADDLGKPGFDEHFGNGRINVWKALLATVNGGVASRISNPEWYGFEIRASLSGPSEAVWNHFADNFRAARIYIDNQLLTDDSNSSAPAKEISLQKRVPGQINLEDEKLIPLPLAELYIEQTDLMSNFSITRDKISNNGGSLKKLQLRQAGVPITFPPFFEMPIDLSMFKSGVPGFVAYDDYVFTIKIPRVVEMKSIQNGITLSLTENVNGKDITYPIGAPGGRLELSISYPGFVPTIENTDVQFFSLETISQTEPENVTNQVGVGVTSKFETDIHDRAETGPVTIRTKTTEFDKVISFSSLDNLIVARAVGFNPEGMEPGDLVQISINVPHFSANTSNTRIKFPGTSPEVAPDQVIAGGAPNVTNVLETKIPEDLEEGPVKVIITVDDNQKVEFEGGNIVLFQKTNYAGAFTFDKMTVTGGGQTFDLLPPPGKRTIPIRFTLNKTIEDLFFLSAAIENGLFALGPEVTAQLDDGALNFQISQTVNGTTSNLEINLIPDNENQSASGSWKGTASNPALGGGSDFEGTFEAQVETQVANYNGSFTGRPKRQSEEGDPELLELLELLLPAEPFINFPLGFVQTDGLVALTFVFQPQGPSGSSSAGAEKFMADGIKDFIASLLATFGNNQNNYAVFTYFVGSLSGNQFTFVDNEETRFPYQDLDPLVNRSTTYELTKSGESLSGTMTFRQEVIDEDEGETRTAQIVFGYSGKLQKEDEDNISIVGISPPPEKGFPPVTGGAVTLTKATVSYNYVSGSEGIVVLRAFKNNNPTDILAQSEVPIQLSVNNAGIATFDNFTIPNVGNDVTTISVIAGLRPTGSSTFIAQSGVISYSR